MSRSRRRPVFGCLFAAVAMVLVSCSQGNSAGGASGAATSPAQLDAAKAAVAEATKIPQNITISTPLKSAPSPGKTLVDLRCDAPSCTLFDDAFKVALGAVGWELRTIPFQNSDPSTLISAMNDALRFNPSAVVLAGADPKLWAGEVPIYEKAGVPLITISIPTLPKMTSPTVAIESEPYDRAHGQLIANWIIDHSQGKGKALVVTLPAYPLFNIMTSAIHDTFAKGCSGCAVEDLEVTIPQFANQQVNPAVIAKLRADPQINYVITLSGDVIAGLPSALASAGLSNRVSIGGTFAHPENMADMMTGRMSAFTNQAEYYTAWMAVDAALRLSEGSPLPTDAYAAGTQAVLLTKDNVGDPKPSWDAPADYANQFKKLWHIG